MNMKRISYGIVVVARGCVDRGIGWRMNWGRQMEGWSCTKYIAVSRLIRTMAIPKSEEKA